jgi:hypothetical protein
MVARSRQAAAKRSRLLRDDVIPKHGEAFDCSNTMLGSGAHGTMVVCLSWADRIEWRLRSVTTHVVRLCPTGWRIPKSHPSCGSYVTTIGAGRRL